MYFTIIQLTGEIKPHSDSSEEYCIWAEARARYESMWENIVNIAVQDKDEKTVLIQVEMEHAEQLSNLIEANQDCELASWIKEEKAKEAEELDILAEFEKLLDAEAEYLGMSPDRKEMIRQMFSSMESKKLMVENSRRNQ